MSMYPPVIIEVEKEIIDDLSDFLAEYKVIDTLDIIEKSKADKFEPIVLENFDNFKMYGGAVTYYKAHYSNEKFTDIFNGKFKEIDELIEKYKNDEVLYIIYVWDTIYAKAWEVINKE